MIAVAPLSLSLSRWGVERNKDSLSILNFTRKFFINSARRTGPSGQWPRWPRWASNLTGAMEATVYQQCCCCLSHSLPLSLSRTTHAGKFYFRQFVSLFLLSIVVSLHDRDDLWPTFSFHFSFFSWVGCSRFTARSLGQGWHNTKKKQKIKKW